MNDAMILAAAVGLFLLCLAGLGLMADSVDRRDARRRNHR